MALDVLDWSEVTRERPGVLGYWRGVNGAKGESTVSMEGFFDSEFGRVSAKIVRGTNGDTGVLRAPEVMV